MYSIHDPCSAAWSCTGRARIRKNQSNERTFISSVSPPHKQCVWHSVAVVIKVSNMATTRKQALSEEVVTLTRPKESCSEIAGALLALGAKVQYLPTITIRAIGEGSELTRDALTGIREGVYAGVVFTSTRAVAFLKALLKDPPGSLPAFSVGPKTSQSLDSYWAGPIHEATTHRAEGLVQTIADTLGHPAKLLFPCSSLARTTLAEGLSRQGHTLTRLELYETNPVTRTSGSVAPTPGSWVVLASPSALQGLNNLGLELEGVRLACIGPTTEQAALKLGLKVDAVAEKPSITGICEAIIRACQS